MPGLGPLEQVYRQIQAQEANTRQNRLKAAWQSYLGDTIGPLRPKRQRDGTTLDDNVQPNKARTIVDKGAFFLFGKDVTFELDDDPDQDSPEEQYLADAWQANAKSRLLMKVGISGGVCGHVFLQIVPDDPRTAPYPRLVLLDPATVTPIYAPNDIEHVLAYVIEYTAPDPKTRRATNYRNTYAEHDDAQAWDVTEEHKAPDQTVWTQDRAFVWEHDYAPLIDTQNLPLPNQFWGLSDIEPDLLNLSRKRAFLLSNWLKIQRYHGAPRTWGRGFSAKELESSIDGTLILPSKEAVLQNLEMQSDQAGASELDRRIDEAIAELSQTPPVAMGKVENIGQLSGLALQILYGPLVDKTEVKRLCYGEMLTELNRRILDLAGLGSDLHAKNVWPEMLPSDPLQERQALALDKEFGVSQDTIQRKLGYNPDQEQKKRKDEQANLGETLLSAFDKGQTGLPGRDGGAHQQGVERA